MYQFSRICPNCKLDRIPEERIVAQKGKKYVVYLCRVCKKSDIERYEDKPKIKFWNGSYFEDETDVDEEQTDK